MTTAAEHPDSDHADDPIWAARGHAIHAFADLEQWLCRLFEELTRMPPQIAAMIFFKITSKRALKDILDKLIRARYPKESNLFWNSFLSLLDKVGRDRDEIVHWTTVQDIQLKEGRVEKLTLQLRSPNLWMVSQSAKRYRVKDLTLFTEKCLFLSNHCSIWLEALPMPDGHSTSETLPDIFRQALVCPDHWDIQLSPTPRTPQTPPRSSRR